MPRRTPVHVRCGWRSCPAAGCSPGCPPARSPRSTLACRSAAYAAGETIYQVAQPASTLLVLAVGRVKLVRPTLDGRDVVVDIVTPGGLFGTLRSLGEHRYPNTAQALTVLDDLASRLEQAHQSLRHHSGGSVQQSVAATLRALADKLGQPTTAPPCCNCR